MGLIAVRQLEPCDPAQAGLECLLTGYLWPGASLWHQAYNL